MTHAPHDRQEAIAAVSHTASVPNEAARVVPVPDTGIDARRSVDRPTVSINRGKGPSNGKEKVSFADAEASLAENLAFTGDLTSRFPTGTGWPDAVRRKCLDCTVGQIAEIRRCHITNCALWPYRFGRSPFHGRAVSEETDNGS